MNKKQARLICICAILWSTISYAAPSHIGVYNGRNAGGYYQLGFIQSVDGDATRWEKADIAPINLSEQGFSHVTKPSLVQVRDNQFLLFAQAREKTTKTWKIIQLDSQTLNDWQHAKFRVLFAGTNPTAYVEHTSNYTRVHLWFEQNRTIHYARSLDAKIWQHYQSVMPTLHHIDWESRGVAPKSIYHDGDRYYLFYSGVSEFGIQQAGVATFRHPLSHYHRDSANPILKAKPHKLAKIVRHTAPKSNRLVVDTHHKFNEGEWVILMNNKRQWEQRQIIKKYDHQTLELNKPPTHQYALSDHIASMARARVYPTMAWKEGLTWYLLSTCYDPGKQVSSTGLEHTCLAQGPSLSKLEWNEKKLPFPFNNNQRDLWDSDSRENISFIFK